MNKLIIASIVLLLAGIGLALGSASCGQNAGLEKCKVPSATEGAVIPCICPGNASCAQTGCLEKCKGSCAAKDADLPCICPNRASCAQTGCLEKCKGSGAPEDGVMPASFDARELKSKCGSSGQGQASSPTKSPACVC